MQEWKNQTLIVLPSLLLQLLMEQYNLSPHLPHREEVFALLFPPPSILSSSSKQITCKIPIPLLVPWVESGLRTPIQHWFSLELPHCSNSISHSHKLYFPLILLYVWKFPTCAWIMTCAIAVVAALANQHSPQIMRTSFSSVQSHSRVRLFVTP